MVFGTPAWLDDLLERLRKEVRDALSLPDDLAFLSLAGDADHLLFPPADRFAAVGGQCRFQAHPGLVAGGGRLDTGLDGVVPVRVFSRVATDQELRDADLLKDRTAGLLADARRVLDRLQMWLPLLDDGTCPLRQPGRLAGIEASPKSPRPGSAWGVVTLGWELAFVAPLT